MPDGGKLTFRTRPVRIEPSSAAASDAARRDEAIVIAVHACGRDVAGKHPDRIFGDIAMAEDFVTPCGGRIKVAHQPGGALAEIMLPGA